MPSPERMHKGFLMGWWMRKPRKELDVAKVQGQGALSGTKQINSDIFTWKKSPKVTHKVDMNTRLDSYLQFPPQPHIPHQTWEE